MSVRPAKTQISLGIRGGVGGGVLKAFHCTNFTLGPDIILNTKKKKKYIKSSVRIMAS